MFEGELMPKFVMSALVGLVSLAFLSQPVGAEDSAALIAKNVAAAGKAKAATYFTKRADDKKTNKNAKNAKKVAAKKYSSPLFDKDGRVIHFLPFNQIAQLESHQRILYIQELR